MKGKSGTRQKGSTFNPSERRRTPASQFSGKKTRACGILTGGGPLGIIETFGLVRESLHLRAVGRERTR